MSWPLPVNDAGGLADLPLGAVVWVMGSALGLAELV